MNEQASAAARVRLQKFLSDAGVASRRRAEELVLEGRVLVNDEIVDALPAFVDPQRDAVIVDGARVHMQRPTYFIIHKPKGVVCTHRDPAGRTRAIDLLPPMPERLFPVGRLDEESTGLLLMTNDGELSQKLTHPRYGVPKIYHVEVRGRAAPDLPEKMKKGVYLSDGRTQASEVEVLHRGRAESVLLITLRDGRDRQVRRLLARLGHPVRKLKRIQVGPLVLKGLPIGAARRLMPKEVDALRRAVAAAPNINLAPPKPRPTRRGFSGPKRGSFSQRKQRGGFQRRPSD